MSHKYGIVATVPVSRVGRKQRNAPVSNHLSVLSTKKKINMNVFMGIRQDQRTKGILKSS